MKKWEYMFLEDYPCTPGEYKADEMGLKGWEMVSATPHRIDDEIRWSMSFKREVAVSASGEADRTER